MKADNLKEMFDALNISFFHRIAQGVKQNNFVPFVVLFMGLGDTHNLRRDLANLAKREVLTFYS